MQNILTWLRDGKDAADDVTGNFGKVDQLSRGRKRLKERLARKKELLVGCDSKDISFESSRLFQ